ncbi:Hypothetical Protein NTJ_15763 [Nesidiocoris tenuis]|uniref:RNA-directed DNA polymerase n=2 Tax=Nesidiocoris tenuis TaxID=355587 RepID=A0ABN7BGU0_9HEMI|nr:Hypothetical Protein NTJ_15763 [Nesidiocoris tenuis]
MPLSRILHHNKALPQLTSSRLLRYASFLSGFDYTVKAKKGIDNVNVDCLSRAPIKYSAVSNDELIGKEADQICAQTVFQISSPAITFSIIQQETLKDPELGKILQNLTTSSEDSEFTVAEGILFRNDRIVIPSSLRSSILNELHQTHLGITKMKQLARRYVYWSGIDHDIERLVKSCAACALVRGNPPKVPIHPWDPPSENWERLHIDYAGPFENCFFLVCIDARSKWAEVKITSKPPTSSSTINLLESIFAFHGYPKVLVSDNASIFVGEEFREYCSNHGVFQKLIAPGHPATNGLAERNVQSLKNKLKAASNETSSIHDKIQRILLRYRATPLSDGKSPAENYLHRKLRIRLDAIFPNRPKPSNVSLMPCRSLHEGERVQVRIHANNKPSWVFGEILKKLGKLHYLVLLDCGRKLKRHVNQLRSSLVAKSQKSVSFGPTQTFDVPKFPVGPDLPQNADVETSPVPDPTSPALPVLQPTVPERPIRPRRLPLRFRDFVM